MHHRVPYIIASVLKLLVPMHGQSSTRHVGLLSVVHAVGHNLNAHRNPFQYELEARLRGGHYPPDRLQQCLAIKRQ